jgi:hypothetical protein
MSGAIPFDRIRDAALAQAGRLLPDWFPAGKQAGREFKVGNIRGDAGESLSINVDNGRWADFAAGQSGYDLIELRAAMRHLGDRTAAARELGELLEITANGYDHYAPPNQQRGKQADDWRPIVPSPPDVARPSRREFDGFDYVYDYVDENDRLLFYVRRREAKDGRRKQFLPLTYGVLNGKAGWHARHPAAPRPLYGLNRLSTKPDAPVLITEGEKAANAAQQMLPDYACITWPGGAKAVKHIDLSPPCGRRIIIWPDNDADGHAAAEVLRRRLPGVSILRVHDLGDGDDAADVSLDDPEAWLASRLSLPTTPPRGTAYGSLTVYSMEDLDTAPARGYLIKGLMAPNEISLWCGPPKCGKSFLLMGVAYKLSLGLHVFGRRVKQVPVLYIAAEGEGGIGNRLKALRQKFGPAPDFHWIAQPVDLFRKVVHLEDLKTAARAYKAGVVVIDTVARAMAGGDENAPADMGQFIMNVAELRNDTQAHIAAIHHGTKSSGGLSPRGHSSLTGAEDALIEVLKDDTGARTATIVHAKDDVDGARIGFALEVVDLGRDDDGDPVTTLVLTDAVEPTAPKAERAKPSKHEAVGLKCLIRAMTADAIMSPVGEAQSERLAVHVEDWRKWFYLEGMPGADQNTKKTTFARVRTGLIAKGVIQASSDYLWPVG